MHSTHIIDGDAAVLLPLDGMRRTRARARTRVLERAQRCTRLIRSRTGRSGGRTPARAVWVNNVRAFVRGRSNNDSSRRGRACVRALAPGMSSMQSGQRVGHRAPGPQTCTRCCWRGRTQSGVRCFMRGGRVRAPARVIEQSANLMFSTRRAAHSRHC